MADQPDGHHIACIEGEIEEGRQVAKELGRQVLCLIDDPYWQHLTAIDHLKDTLLQIAPDLGAAIARFNAQGPGKAAIDVDALAQFEQEARGGRVEALYNLGLAYSTGQGAGVDYVAAHKWFNLAAIKGSDEARRWRAQISSEMSPAQISEAQREARKWLDMAAAMTSVPTTAFA